MVKGKCFDILCYQDGNPLSLGGVQNYLAKQQHEQLHFLFPKDL